MNPFETLTWGQPQDPDLTRWYAGERLIGVSLARAQSLAALLTEKGHRSIVTMSRWDIGGYEVFTC